MTQLCDCDSQQINREGESLTIEIGIVEDLPELCRRYSNICSRAGDMHIAWMAGSVQEALHRLSQQVPAVLLVDIGLPDGSGIEVIRRAATLRQPCEIMVVSMFGDEDNVVAAIEAGAMGYILKDSLEEEFHETIRDLVAGGSPISPNVARILLRRSRRRPEPTAGTTESIELSERESEILNLVAKGFGYAEIARLLAISANTVRTHVYRIYNKLSVHSRTEAVYEATRIGLIVP